MMDAFASLVLTAPPGGFWTLTAVALLAGSAALWRAQVFLARQRLIEDTPTAFIRSAPQGYIELQGRPTDGRRPDPCAALVAALHLVSRKVERREQRGNGRGRRAAHTIEQGVSGDLFYLVDDTGRCAIDPDGASVTPAHRQVWYGAQRIPGRYHADDGRWWARALGRLGQRYRYTERRIEPGDPLYALGRFVTHSASANPTDHGPEIAARLREWKRDRAFLRREFDRDGNGEIDAAGWAAARGPRRRRGARGIARRRATTGRRPARTHRRPPPPVHHRRRHRASRGRTLSTARQRVAGARHPARVQRPVGDGATAGERNSGIMRR